MATAPLNIPIKITGDAELDALYGKLNRATTATERLALAEKMRAVAYAKYEKAAFAASKYDDTGKEKAIKNIEKQRLAEEKFIAAKKQWTKVHKDTQAAIRGEDDAANRLLKTKNKEFDQLMRLEKARLQGNRTQRTGTNNINKEVTAVKNNTNALGKSTTATQKYGTQMARASNNIKDSGNNLGILNTSLGKFSVIMSGLAATIFVLQNIVQLFKALAGFVEKVERQLSFLNFTLMAKDYEAAKNIIVSSNQNIKGSIADTAVSFRVLKAAGMEMTGIKDIMPDISDFAHITQSSMGKASEVLTGTLKAMRMGLSDLPKLLDVIATTSKYTNIQLDQVNNYFKESAPAAGAYGYSLSQLAAIMIILKQNNVDVKETSHEVGQAIIKNEEIARKYNIQGSNLVQTLGALYRKGMSAADMAKEFGFQQAEVTTILAKSSEQFKTLSNEIDKTHGSFDKLKEQFKEDLSPALKELSRVITVFIEKVWDKYGDAIVNVIKDTTQWISEHTDTLTLWIDRLVKINSIINNLTPWGMAKNLYNAGKAIGEKIKTAGNDLLDYYIKNFLSIDPRLEKSEAGGVIERHSISVTTGTIEHDKVKKVTAPDPEIDRRMLITKALKAHKEIYDKTLFMTKEYEDHLIYMAEQSHVKRMLIFKKGSINETRSKVTLAKELLQIEKNKYKRIDAAALASYEVTGVLNESYLKRQRDFIKKEKEIHEQGGMSPERAEQISTIKKLALDKLAYEKRLEMHRDFFEITRKMTDAHLEVELEAIDNHYKTMLIKGSMYSKEQAELYKKQATLQVLIKKQKKELEIYEEMYEQIGQYASDYFTKNETLLELERQNNELTTGDMKYAWDVYYDSLNLLRQKDLMNQGTYLSGIQAGLLEVIRKSKKHFTEFAKAGYNSVMELEKTFENFFFNVFKGEIDSAKDLWKTFMDFLIDEWLRAAAKMLSQKFIMPIVGSILSTVGSVLFGGGTASASTGGGSVLGSLSSLGSLDKIIPGLTGWLGSTITGGTTAGTWGISGYAPGSTTTGILGGATWGGALGAGALGSMGYSTLGSWIGLPQNGAYTQVGSGLGGIGGFLGGSALGTFLGGMGAASGSALGGLGGISAGAIAGSVVPVIGTIIGAIIGGLIGNMLGPDKPNTYDYSMMSANYPGQWNDWAGGTGLFADAPQTYAANETGVWYAPIHNAYITGRNKINEEFNSMVLDYLENAPLEVSDMIENILRETSFAHSPSAGATSVTSAKEGVEIALQEYGDFLDATFGSILDSPEIKAAIQRIERETAIEDFLDLMLNIINPERTEMLQYEMEQLEKAYAEWQRTAELLDVDMSVVNEAYEASKKQIEEAHAALIEAAMAPIFQAREAIDQWLWALDAQAGPQSKELFSGRYSDLLTTAQGATTPEGYSEAIGALLSYMPEYLSFLEGYGSYGTDIPGIKEDVLGLKDITPIVEEPSVAIALQNVADSFNSEEIGATIAGHIITAFASSPRTVEVDLDGKVIATAVLKEFRSSGSYPWDEDMNY